MDETLTPPTRKRLGVAMFVYIILTEARVRVYTAEARAIKVSDRARRMGVAHEYIAVEARRGDPYKGVKCLSANQRWRKFLEEDSHCPRWMQASSTPRSHTET